MSLITAVTTFFTPGCACRAASMRHDVCIDELERSGCEEPTQLAGARSPWIGVSENPLRANRCILFTAYTSLPGNQNRVLAQTPRCFLPHADQRLPCQGSRRSASQRLSVPLPFPGAGAAAMSSVAGTAFSEEPVSHRLRASCIFSDRLISMYRLTASNKNSSV